MALLIQSAFLRCREKVNFDKVIKMVDDMVALLEQEQRDDDHKKDYCEGQFDPIARRKTQISRLCMFLMLLQRNCWLLQRTV